MICPHCGIGTSPQFEKVTIGKVATSHFNSWTGNCTECDELIVMGAWSGAKRGLESGQILLYPRGPRPRLLPPEVSDEYAQDFREASIVLQFSPKASAALSRRLLQHILREKAGTREDNLDAEIQDLLDRGHLPADLAEDLDMVRTVGNFTSHPIKSTNSGEVVDVGPGEAESLLDVLEELLDYYVARPARRAKKREQLNEKLAEAGEPPVKASDLPSAAQSAES